MVRNKCFEVLENTFLCNSFLYLLTECQRKVKLTLNEQHINNDQTQTPIVTHFLSKQNRTDTVYFSLRKSKRLIKFSYLLVTFLITLRNQCGYFFFRMKKMYRKDRVKFKKPILKRRQAYRTSVFNSRKRYFLCSEESSGLNECSYLSSLPSFFVSCTSIFIALKTHYEMILLI